MTYLHALEWLAGELIALTVVAVAGLWLINRDDDK